MKYLPKVILVFLGLALVLPACRSTHQIMGFNRSGDISCSSFDDKSISLIAKAVGENHSEASYNAEIKAFENLFYKGIPNSNQLTPMIPERQRKGISHERLFIFFQDSTHRHFIIDTKERYYQVQDGHHFLEEEITIDMIELHDYLVDHFIIKDPGR